VDVEHKAQSTVFSTDFLYEAAYGVVVLVVVWRGIGIFIGPLRWAVSTDDEAVALAVPDV
jgi:hypothetical protein